MEAAEARREAARLARQHRRAYRVAARLAREAEAEPRLFSEVNTSSCAPTLAVEPQSARIARRSYIPGR